MKRLIACGLIALNLFIVSCSKDEIESKNDNVSFTITQEILSLTNAHRNNMGLGNLERSVEADQLALEHTRYMITQGNINHDNFMKRMEALRGLVDAIAVGENVAYGYATSESVMEGWLNSSGHKANIEGDYTHIGIAAVKAEGGGFYYMQLFFR